MSKKNNRLIVIGAGGHAKSCIELIENQNKYSIYGIIDKSNKKKFMNYRIIGNDDELKNFKSKVDNQKKSFWEKAVLFFIMLL